MLTLDDHLRRVVETAGHVRRSASVVGRVLGAQRGKVQHRRELSHLANGDAFQVAGRGFRAALVGEQRNAILEPLDLERRVALDHRAQNVVALAFVQRFGKHELIDDRSNCGRDGN